ncbi:MAG: phosphoglycerate dehydrogenase, partial [Planctomycetota bacterium]
PRSNASGDSFETPLHGCPNVILTPHIGGSTLEAQENIAIEVAEKLLRYCDNGSTRSAVNFPEVALPEHTDKHRLLHIHRNEPGVLSQVNAAIADSGVNIAAQYLQTHADVGYVVMDVDSDYSSGALDRLRSINATIRSRVLF